MESPVAIKDLTTEELRDVYLDLFGRYLELCEAKDADAQRIHELNRNLETARAAEAYLMQELEQLTASPKIAPIVSKSRTELKLDDLRLKYNELEAEFSNMQQECERVRSENIRLSKLLAEVPLATENITEQKRQQRLELDNLHLLEKLEELQDIIRRHTLSSAEKEKTIELLKNQVKCLEENFKYKQENLDEVALLLEGTQEQLTEANARIAMLTTSENNNSKGNSLFAEVDDQRKAMKQLLAAQKKTYMEMKKSFNESEHEIRRLKRENGAMHTELQACSSIFFNAEKTYQGKLIERIRELMTEKDDVEEKLNWTQERLKKMAKDNDVAWLNSMLEFCKQETTKLKSELHSVRIQKASLEEQLRNSQQEMSRWRFELLKSRCVLNDRENLLAEHEIAFMPMNEVEISVSKLQQQSTTPPSTNGSSVHDEAPQIPQRDNVVLSGSDKNSEDISPGKKGFNVEKDTLLQEWSTPPINNDNKENRNVCNEESENPTKIVEQNYTDLMDEDLKRSCSSRTSKESKSILCKNQSLLPRVMSKSVQFASNDIVKDSENITSNVKATAIQIRKKTNVIVRKVVLKSKNQF